MVVVWLLGFVDHRISIALSIACYWRCPKKRTRKHWKLSWIFAWRVHATVPHGRVGAGNNMNITLRGCCKLCYVSVEVVEVVEVVVAIQCKQRPAPFAVFPIQHTAYPTNSLTQQLVWEYLCIS